MEAVVTATAHIDDSAGSPAVSAEMTVAEAPTSKTSAAVVPTAEAPAKVATAETTAAEVTAAEVTASPTATEVAAERRRVGRREHADWNRNGGGSEHRLDCLADHHALQCIAGRTVRIGD